MTMENPSTCLKANSASLRSEANVLERTLAVTQLYEQFRRRIYAHIYRLLGSRENADDVTQEVFVSAYLTWDDLDARDNLSAWLYRTATNLCIDLLRRRKRISHWSHEHTAGVRDGDDSCCLADSGRHSRDCRTRAYSAYILTFAERICPPAATQCFRGDALSGNSGHRRYFAECRGDTSYTRKKAVCRRVSASGQ